MRPTYATLTVLVIAGLALLPSAAAALPERQVPPLPPGVDELPPLPEPDQKAVFNVVVEGEGEARRAVSLDGGNGVCFVSSRTNSYEHFSYQRGKGVRLVFLRYGRGVLMRRQGRRQAGVALFNVRGNVLATASGTASRTGPSEVCPLTTETVGDEPRCGERSRALDYALAFDGARLALTLRGDALPPLPTPQPTLCGTNGVESLSGPPLHGFESPPELAPAPLSRRRIFGQARALKFKLAAPPASTVTDAAFAGFSGSAVDTGENTAILRLVRLR